jgi:hypothetical protein
MAQALGAEVKIVSPPRKSSPRVPQAA